MRFATCVLLVGLGSALMTGCGWYQAPVKPPQGWVYSSISAPMDYTMEGKSLGSKQGTAGSCQILGLVAWGDASVSAAAREGKLTTINHVDYKYLNVLGVYSSFTTVAIGE